MERSSLVSEQVDEEADFNLKEWDLRARRISRENTTISRRFSASNLKSFREEARSFPSNVTVSSTASSPGYTAREEIDPSTYSFTTALRALQAKTVYTWELQPRDAGLILNSKWNEAEKYISNPLSGQVPIECLSAKTLSGRSFRGLTTRISMSAPLIYPSHLHHFHPNPPIKEHESHVITSNAEKKKKETETETKTKTKTRDVGTQSTPVEVSSSSPTPAPTPSIQERSINMADSSVSFKSADTEVETNETSEREISIKINGGEREQESRGAAGCLLSLRNLWMRRRRTQTHKQKHKTTTDNSNRLSTFLHHFNGCTSKE